MPCLPEQWNNQLTHIDTLRRWQWKDPPFFNLGGGFTYFYYRFLYFFLAFTCRNDPNLTHIFFKYCRWKPTASFCLVISPQDVSSIALDEVLVPISSLSRLVHVVSARRSTNDLKANLVTEILRNETSILSSKSFW